MERREGGVSVTSELARPPADPVFVDTTLDPPAMFPIAVIEPDPDWSRACGDWPSERPVWDPLGFAVRLNGERRFALLADYDEKEDQMAGRPGDQRLDRARQWLKEYLEAAEEGVKFAEIVRDGGLAGHKLATIRRASELLPIEKTKVGYGPRSYGVWTLTHAGAALGAQLMEDLEAAVKDAAEPASEPEPGQYGYEEPESIRSPHDDDELVRAAWAVAQAKAEYEMARETLRRTLDDLRQIVEGAVEDLVE